METEKEPIDLTDDGQVKKRIIREGVGTTPSKNSAVSGKLCTPKKYHVKDD